MCLLASIESRLQKRREEEREFKECLESSRAKRSGWKKGQVIEKGEREAQQNKIYLGKKKAMDGIAEICYMKYGRERSVC